MAEKPSIQIVGARQHNLQNLSVEIPRNQLVVITGVSGSGKSSLAFNTLYAEGQRRYVESLSAYARQFLERLEKPDVDFIEGLSPAIAIEQRGTSPNPRSTIATTTEIYDYLRILFAAIGQPHDPETGEVLTRDTPVDIIATLLDLPERSKVILLAPLTPVPGETPGELFARLRQQGFVRIRVDGEMYELDTIDKIKTTKKSLIEIVVDRLVIRADIRSRLADSLEIALKWSEGEVTALSQSADTDNREHWDEHHFTTTFRNPATGFTLSKLTPKHFSFNSHLGACPTCHGLGKRLVPDPELMVPDPKKSIDDGAIKTWWSGSKKRRGLHQRAILALAEHFNEDPDAPLTDLSQEFKRALFYGTDGEKLSTASAAWNKPFEGLSVQAKRLLEDSKSEITKVGVRRFMSHRPCPGCEGKRLRPAILAVTVAHENADEEPRSIHDFTTLPISDALRWMDGVVLTEQQKTFAVELVNEIRKRLAFLHQVGLGYLTLHRESGTLSGGESQRIRLATQLGAGLAGVLYVLDEPSIGLHQADNAKLIETLRHLRDIGNTVIVVEHDEDTIRAADHVLDLGPGAGPEGGQLLAQGTPTEIEADLNSITGQWLTGEENIAIPPPTSSLVNENLVVHDASHHNLQHITATFPLGRFTCVTGVSGSGKSTLVDTVLRRALFRHFHQSRDIPGEHAGIDGLEHIDKVIVIDQGAIGRSPRSNPATYIGMFGPIRDLFAQLPASRACGYEPGRFSFNVSGGRCEACQGDGLIKIDMHFLSDVYVTCEICNGRRYNRETLDVTYRGKNIADILEMTVAEALIFFQNIPKIHQRLKALNDVGLGYVKLGQSATTLSGGEAQRIKLAAELGKTATGNTVYLLDEPTTGLHFADIATLLEVFYRLRDAGNTLIVIEHNLDVIKCADWILDLGPGGGKHGGQLIAEGRPEDIVANVDSVTGKYLERYF